MWPRSHDRGELRRILLIADAVNALQCGHGLTTVENKEVHRPGLVSSAASMWPRSHDRGEHQTTSAFSMRLASFNVATVSRPWRTSRQASSLPIPTRRFNVATVS